MLEEPFFGGNSCMTDLYIRKNKDSKDTMKLSAYKDLSLLVDGSYLFLPKLTRRLL